MPQRYLQGCVEVVQFDERLTVNEVQTAAEVLTAVVGSHLPQVVIDLRRVRLIDSAGLELIYDTHNQCASRGGALHLASVSPLVRDIFRITGLDSELMVHRDVVSAAGAFAL